ncbi:MNIO family bufferin maturase [Magnetococcus sp. PR-3]|uniref:MNIO family bufferin maturase n=1 Tax=Magnetococcus sp. PR-3 TaxID=3120355 RepID=UPI002FCE279A
MALTPILNSSFSQRLGDVRKVEKSCLTAYPPTSWVGVGYREVHAQTFPVETSAVGWIEVHPENYMVAGGARLARLDELRCHYPISAHGVGLSLGRSDDIDRAHLSRLKQFIDRYEPALISEHLSWSMFEGVYYNDLLPLPYDDEALAVVARHIDVAQEYLGRTLLIENPSRYISFNRCDEREEPEFMNALCAKTGCGVLLDINNVVVSGHNLGLNVEAYFEAIEDRYVGEIHVAGHRTQYHDGESYLLDDHGCAPCEEVVAYLQKRLAQFGPRPVLLEWDTNLPSVESLLATAHQLTACFSTPVKPLKGSNHAYSISTV